MLDILLKNYMCMTDPHCKLLHFQMYLFQFYPKIILTQWLIHFVSSLNLLYLFYLLITVYMLILASYAWAMTPYQGSTQQKISVNNIKWVLIIHKTKGIILATGSKCF